MSAEVAHRTGDLPDPPAQAEAPPLPCGIRQGDGLDFDGFVHRYKNRLFAYILYRVSDRHRAEDLTQEVFLRAFRATAREKSLGPGGIGAWLFTIARNCVREFLRSSARKPLLLETELGGEPLPSRKPRSSEAADPMRQAQEADERRRIDGLFARLPDDQREVLVLRVYGGLTVAEIAESTGASLGTVKSRMRYGLLKIRGMIQPS